MSFELSDKDILEAEKRRQERAKQVNILGVSRDCDVSNTERAMRDVIDRIKKIPQGENLEKIRNQENARKVASLRADSNAPVRHIQKRRERTDLSTGEFVSADKQWDKAKNAVKAMLSGGFIAALVGIRGSGKTQIGVELILESTQALRSAYYTTAMEIFVAIRSSYAKSAGASEQDVVASFLRPKLLVIDEIHERGETKWEDGILTHIIDRRYRDMNDTILIGNYTLEEFEASMGKSVVNRTNETGGVIVCNWRSFRE